jgi:hypothetical protein
MVTLNKIKKYETQSDLEKAVKDIIINEIDGDAEMFFQDLFNHGCISGMIGALIYFEDTKKFYIDNMDDIDDLADEMEQYTGETLKPTSPRYNWLAWFGFEETARNIYSNCGGTEW